MYSFARLVQLYRRKLGDTGHAPRMAEILNDVAGDLQIVFASRNWTFFENQFEDDIWGTDSITISSVNGSVVTFSETWDDNWLKQDLTFTGSTGRHIIDRKNDDNSFIIAPDHTGDAVASGTTGNIYQTRILLPADFGALRGPVLFDNLPLFHVSPYEMEMATAAGHTGPATNVSIQGSRHDKPGEGRKYMRLFPSQAGRLRFRYSYMPDTETLFEYREGQALVQGSDLRRVTGSGTQWKVLPGIGVNTVFESQSAVMSGFPHHNDVVVAIDNSNLTLDTDWTGTLGSKFDYVISSKLNLPPFMDRVLRFMAERYAGKRGSGDAQYLAALQDAKMADSKDRSFPSRSQANWGAIVKGQGNTSFIVGY